MDKATKASFRFSKYIIKRANLYFSGNKVSKNIELGFSPKGVVLSDKKIFILSLETSINDKDIFKVDLEAEAQFEYDDAFGESLEKFLTTNAPALLFPYIRAYISNITALSGIPPVVLPTINMAGLSDTLKNNIEYK